MAESRKRGRKSKKPLQGVTENPINYEFGQLLYEGNFAKVGIVQNLSNGQEFALKTTNLEDRFDPSFLFLFHEVIMLKGISHPNIIKVLACWNQSHHIAFMMPLMSYRSCADVCREKFPNGITEHAMGVILTHILQALEYIHENGIVHRAVKGSHILISEGGVAVLSGFKFAVKFEKNVEVIHSDGIKLMTKCLNWLSPEFLSQDKRGYKKNTDVYSLGITILELCNGVVPFADMTSAAMLVQKVKFGATKLWDKTQLPSTEGIPSTSMEGCLASDSEEEDLDFDVRMAATDRDAAYANKCYSKAFHHFTNCCLVSDNQMRPDVGFLIKHKFVKAYCCDAGSSSLIPYLDLKEPLHFQTNPDEDSQCDFEFKKSASDVGMSWDFD